MAEINIERKSGPPAWLWIVGALVLGLIAWAVISMMGRDDTDEWTTAQDTTYAAPAATTPAAGMAAAPAALQTYNTQCSHPEGTRPDTMGPEHEFAVNCFEQLAGAIEAVAGQMTGAPNVSSHVATIRENARQIRDSGVESTQHANWSRAAASAGADAIESLQQASGRTDARSAVGSVRQAVDGLQRSELQTEQQGQVRSFFRNAGQALETLARPNA